MAFQSFPVELQAGWTAEFCNKPSLASSVYLPGLPATYGSLFSLLALSAPNAILKIGAYTLTFNMKFFNQMSKIEIYNTLIKLLQILPSFCSRLIFSHLYEKRRISKIQYIFTISQYLPRPRN